MVDRPAPMTQEEAIAIAREIGDALGGRQKVALELLCRLVERRHRASQPAIHAIGSPGAGAQHFAKAQDEITHGREQVRAIDLRSTGADLPGDPTPDE